MKKRMFLLFCFLWSLGCLCAMWLCIAYQMSMPDEIPEETQAAFVAQELNNISFPSIIPGTSLLLRGLYPYDGAFWEDGSGLQVTGVTALLVENVGEYGIDYARVIVGRGNNLLQFSIEMIPPGAQTVALEQGRTPYSDDIVVYCYGTQYLQLDGWDMPGITCEGADSGTLVLTNITKEPIEDLCIYFKDYLQGIYIGGAVNLCPVDEILPGETVLLSPDRYSTEGSKVLCVLSE